MGNIILLPQEVSAKIAAGEVIDGPYSVVRELIDNALDAHASLITITINNGGKDFIWVSDDGSGMSQDDAVLSVKKHTTSKIGDIEDLDSLTTMGFRGEALSSICTVSDFTMITKTHEEEHGTKVQCSFGRDVVSAPSPANPGTRITVKDLFCNLPARKKFLKSNRAESARIKDEVLKKSLSFYKCGFVYKADDKTVYRLDPHAHHRERIAALFGKNLEENLTDVSFKDDSFSLSLLISNRNFTLPNRSGQFFFYNGRPITDRSLTFTLNNPARGIVPLGRYIYAFVFIDIDPHMIDINVHPSKKEVRVKNAEKIYSSVQRCVRQVLEQRFYTTGRFPNGGLPNGVFPKRGFSNPSIQVDKPGGYLNEKVLSSGFESAKVREKGLFQEQGERQRVDSFSPQIAEHELKSPQEELFLSPDMLFSFRGTLFHTYLLFESGDLFFLVDQHAAHERILYELFLQRCYEEKDLLKPLLIPINFTPPRTKYDELLGSIDAFKEAGIEMEPFGDESINIVSLPAFVPERQEETTVSLLLEEYYDGALRPEAKAIRDRFLKLAACKAAIREGDLLSEQEALSLLKDLMKQNIPYICPHGRPTVVKVTKASIDRLFKRR